MPSLIALSMSLLIDYRGAKVLSEVRGETFLALGDTAGLPELLRGK